MKKLILMRLAKSSWDDPKLTDQDRPLNDRGRKSADLIAAYIAKKKIDPAVVLCSSALRARETLDVLRDAFKSKPVVKIEDKLYSATAEQLMARLKRASPTAPSILLIGHNPAMETLTRELASSGAMLKEVRAKFPTAGLVILEAPIEQWRELAHGVFKVQDFVTPKKLGKK